MSYFKILFSKNLNPGENPGFFPLNPIFPETRVWKLSGFSSPLLMYFTSVGIFSCEGGTLAHSDLFCTLAIRLCTKVSCGAIRLNGLRLPSFARFSPVLDMRFQGFKSRLFVLDILFQGFKERFPEGGHSLVIRALRHSHQTVTRLKMRIIFRSILKWLRLATARI